jgi:CrcB protein
VRVGWRELLAVIIGGALGTGLRLAVDTALPHASNEFPVSTLAVNVVGAFALGYLVARVWPTAVSWLRAGLGAGLLGSFTTFSALAVSVVSLGFTPVGVLYLGLSVVLGLGAAFGGLAAGGHLRTELDEVNE